MFDKELTLAAQLRYWPAPTLEAIVPRVQRLRQAIFYKGREAAAVMVSELLWVKLLAEIGQHLEPGDVKVFGLPLYPHPSTPGVAVTTAQRCWMLPA